jgi:hypothetical protein
LPQDERNAAVFEQNRSRELHEVLAGSHHIFRRYLIAVAALSEEDLNDPRRFASMPEGMATLEDFVRPQPLPSARRFHSGVVGEAGEQNLTAVFRRVVFAPHSQVTTSVLLHCTSLRSDLTPVSILVCALLW